MIEVQVDLQERAAGGSTSKVAGGLNLPYLDALRGWAIMLVVLVHAGGCTLAYLAPDTPELSWAAFGARGVQLFYMLSAFTLMLSIDSARPQRHPLRNFFARRFFRIAPLFYLAALLYVVDIYLMYKTHLPFLNMALGIFFLNGLRPAAINSVALGGWSIAVEMSFYAILPFLYAHLRTAGRALAAALLSAVVFWHLSTALQGHFHGPVWRDYLYTFWFPVEFPVFLLGMAVYAFWKHSLMPWALRATARQRQLVSVVLLLATPLPLLATGLPQIYVASMAGCPLILALSIWPWPLLQNRVTILLGRVSYSLYLLHFYVIILIQLAISRLDTSHFVGRMVRQHPGSSVMGFWVLTVIASVPVAMVSAHFIEGPGMALGRRLIKRWEQAPA